MRQPLEACLVAEDGVTPAALVQALVERLRSASPLAPLLGPHAERLKREAGQLVLHPVAQLLLTVGQTTRPESFRHAVDAMALCGALMLGSGGDTPAVRLAMLCGLLHDLGEIYIAPQHGEAEADRELDFLSYQQLVVHPHVGQLLVAQLTNYPGAVARAIAEHHERLDGSGYPHALRGEQMSALGRLLAVSEAALNTLRRNGDHLLRASIALRAVPGEFDLAWVGQLSKAARTQPPLHAVMELADIQARLAALDYVLGVAETHVNQLAMQAPAPGSQEALGLALFLLGRLRAGWNESGLWNPATIAEADAAEVEAMEDELYFRLRGVQRATLLRAGELPAEEAAALSSLCDSLAMGTA